MPQVGVQQPTNLMEMFSSPSMMLGDIAANQVNDQALGNLINRQQAAQSMDIEKQKLPFELSRLGLENQGLEADLPLKRANAGLKQNDLEISNATKGNAIKAKISELAKTVSDNDLAQAENGVKQLMIHPDPKIRASAKPLFDSLYEIRKERDKLSIQGGNNIAGIRAQGEEQRKLEDQQARHGKYAKAFNVNLNTKLMLEGDPIKRDTLLRGALQQAQNECDSDRVEELSAYLNANKAAYDNAMKAKMASVGGKPDAAALTGMTPVEIPQAQPPVGVGATQEPQTSSISPAMITQAFGSYEPNKYEYRVNPQTGRLQRKAK